MGSGVGAGPSVTGGRGPSRFLEPVLVVAAALYAISLVPGVRPGGPGYVAVLDLGLSCAVLLLGAACCALRSVRDAAERSAWAAAALALAVYTCGDVYFMVALMDLPEDRVPYPSLADGAWFAMYPLLLLALVRLVRARVGRVSRTLWLDGLGAGAGAAAVVGAVVVRPLLEVSGADAVLVATTLAFPVADLALLMVAVAVLHLYDWRTDRTWTWLLAGGVTLLVADIAYMLQTAHGTYIDAGPLDAAWPLAATCFGLAAGGRASRPRVASPRQGALAVPVALSLAGTAVLSVGAAGASPLPAVVCALGALSVLLASARLLLTLRETRRLAQAQREARTDELTGLPNRRELMTRLDGVVRAGDRRGSAGAVLLIDLDRFKEVNDTLGHHHGDALLRSVAHRLGAVFREGDTVARLGGDEFAVLLPEVADVVAAEALARRCTQALEEDFVVEGLALRVEASVGLAMAPLHGRDAHALMRAADVAMYEAKAGNLGVVVYDAASDVHTPTRLALLGDLRRALQNDELVMHYQPKVDLGADRVTGVEALVRWHHPVRGELSPAEFVPAAESTGLIMPLTVRTLALAVAEAVGWMHAGHPLQVAVNLSARCLQDPDLPGRVRHVLAEHGLPARLLRLEVTETTLMVDPPRALAILSELQALGVSLSIDDFGTGYSSMSYLNRMPVDELKIDGAFVLAMLGSSRDGVLVRSSIELGHSLGLAVVAEGVEDEATMAALSELGCDVVQGYHLARPMRPEQMIEWLEGRSGAPGVGVASAATA